MIKAMTTQEAADHGYSHGRSLAKYNVYDIRFGETIEGVGPIETVDDWIEAFNLVIQIADEHSRCFTPFEFVAASINARDAEYGEFSAEEGWRSFEDGVTIGANAYRMEYYPIERLEKDLEEYQKEKEEV